jgi:hypothetical protein
MIVDSELERIWQEAVVAYFEALSRIMPGEIKGNY